ncbi:hypothetical protein BATDEDRAFT_27094 [Batrachochytrium dendrobatidis JAM81]|uniref:Uncharacterized protein n=1 Tax=Batrachochytrium dendrobatidis (strain JAM81 / FGSC 10211) TaxID=684364 RepID=F4P9Q9_BATDJ|nr:uncharacterized protein BATDEDRAFT_27094 [Batrachochytrium dendrobatidis JAM81]EGF77964.1 hypothetical protein BATDEDRAFT_27094 [Batrachochytrium dendrobatidis JAM81]KAJ8330265.1 hypothetical protein O5D80_001828 [Batrachochytrium dendrobatidis]KAK5670318.1 hypothetical protein QVD99_003014 [Batrachochytrium dendrobatidis]|eukprot:XP_006681376.1 hypothetical protein BATDEDRAFT_27094 [Batrachochytrium dendrobatidis JAM81]
MKLSAIFLSVLLASAASGTYIKPSSTPALVSTTPCTDEIHSSQTPKPMAAKSETSPCLDETPKATLTTTSVATAYDGQTPLPTAAVSHGTTPCSTPTPELTGSYTPAGVPQTKLEAIVTPTPTSTPLSNYDQDVPIAASANSIEFSFLAVMAALTAAILA